MKLFILNKKDFDEHFMAESKSIHISAYNILKQSIETNYAIPILIRVNLGNSEVHFEFVNKSAGTFYYEFIGTAA